MFRDRLSNRTVEELTGIYMPGQLAYTESYATSIPGLRAKPDDFVLPAADGLLPGQRSRIDPDAIPDEDALQLLLQPGTMWLKKGERTWLDWFESPPLIPQESLRFERVELERVLEQELGALEAVSTRPTKYLKHEEERIAVARCKRPSHRAARVLSARTDDWYEVTIAGPEPKRILAVRVDEQLDIYENRLAVALVINLESWLRQRISELQRRTGLFEQHRRFQSTSGGLGYWRSRRISSLWGEAFREDASEEGLKLHLQFLRTQLRRVQRLKGTPLFRELRSVGSSRLQVQWTNLLRHDAVYRRVALLWDKWEAAKRGTLTDAAAEWQKGQRAAGAFATFSSLVVVRALEVLGYGPADDNAKFSLTQGELQLNGPAGPLKLRIDHSSIYLQRSDSASSLRFTAISACPGAATHAGDWLNSLKLSSSNGVIYMPSATLKADPMAQDRLLSLGNQGDAGPMFVPIAPWDLESVERVARAIRWFAWNESYGQYPPKIEVPSNWQPPNELKGWTRLNGTSLEVVRAPDQAADAECVKRRLDLNARELKQLEEEIALTKEEKGGGKRGDKTRYDKVRQLKYELDKKRTELDRKIVADKPVAERLKGAAVQLERLLSCPVCQKKASSRDFQATGGFRCSCRNCTAIWELHECGACHEKYPVIRPVSLPEPPSPLDFGSLFGADVLAVPTPMGNFVCPHCGNHKEELSRSPASSQSEASEEA